MNDNKMAFNTRVIHAGQAPDPSTGAIMPPIYATSTYVQSSPGVHKGYEYSRSQNPTREAFERCVADLENGARGFAGQSLSARSTSSTGCSTSSACARPDRRPWPRILCWLLHSNAPVAGGRQGG